MTPHSLPPYHSLGNVELQMEADKDPGTLGVFVPAADSKLAQEVWKGSGVVGSPVGKTGRLRLDYEGDDDIYPSYADRVERAAERHQVARPGGGQGYPTRASAYVDRDEVIEVGRWNPVERELTVTDTERVSTWLE